MATDPTFPWPEHTQIGSPGPRRSLELTVEAHRRAVERVGRRFKKQAA